MSLATLLLLAAVTKLAFRVLLKQSGSLASLASSVTLTAIMLGASLVIIAGWVADIVLG